MARCLCMLHRKREHIDNILTPLSPSLCLWEPQKIGLSVLRSSPSSSCTRNQEKWSQNSQHSGVHRQIHTSACTNTQTHTVIHTQMCTQGMDTAEHTQTSSIREQNLHSHTTTSTHTAMSNTPGPIPLHTSACSAVEVTSAPHIPSSTYPWAQIHPRLCGSRIV